MELGVDALRQEQAHLQRALADPDAPRVGISDLADKEYRQWAALRIVVLSATIAEYAYLDSLLERPLSDDERRRMVDELVDEDVDAYGREAAERVDWRVSDWQITREHEAVLEARAEGLGDE